MRPGWVVEGRADHDRNRWPTFLTARQTTCVAKGTKCVSAAGKMPLPSGKSTASVPRLASAEQNEIWSQLHFNYGEAQMFSLFLLFGILPNRPSLLPSLPAPLIRQAAARKPRCIHSSWCKHQLIIHPAITQCTIHWFPTLILFQFNFYTIMSQEDTWCKPCEATGPCSVCFQNYSGVYSREKNRTSVIAQPCCVSFSCKGMAVGCGVT